MAFDDSCFDFILAHANKTLPPAQNALRLLGRLEWYAGSYPKELIDALRQAAKRVISRPGDQDALLWLLVLAEDWNLFFDDDGNGGSAADKWCARWRKQIQDVGNGQCPFCHGPY